MGFGTVNTPGALALNVIRALALATEAKNIVDEVNTGLQGLITGEGNSPGTQNKTLAEVLTDVLGNKASLAHAAQHATGGSDPITPASIGAAGKDHVHNYAGAATAGGAATSAEKLTGTLGISGGGTGGTTAAAALKNLISACTALTASGLATGDSIPLLDASASTGKKVTLANLAEYLMTSGGGAKIATGSYTGTGTYGANNPCTLTFPFVPKLVMIARLETSSGTSLIKDDCTFAIYIAGMSHMLTHRYESDYWYPAGVTVPSKTQTFKWYSSKNAASNQLNKQGDSYYYIALG